MVGTVFTILSYVLLGASVAFCVFVMANVLADILKSKKEVPAGILFVSKHTGEIYANLYTDPTEFENGQIVRMTVTHLDTK